MASSLLNIILRASRLTRSNYSSSKSVGECKSLSVKKSDTHVRAVRTNALTRAKPRRYGDKDINITTKTTMEQELQEECGVVHSQVQTVIDTPTIVRSTLPINFLQTGNIIEESKLLENVLLGPNKKLAVPWPSYSERKTANKVPRIVYPAATEVSKSFKRDASTASLDVQKRGISRFSKIPNEEEVMHSINQKSLGLQLKNGQISSSILPRFKSSYSDPCEEKFVEEKREVICNPSIKKKIKKRKTLPVLVSADCPCPDSGPMTDFRLRKLKPRYHPKDPPRICIREDAACEERGVVRADDGLRVREKELPKIVPGDCPCADFALNEGPKLKRPKFKEIKEPPRPVCREEGDCEGIPRSDTDDWEYIIPKECIEEKKDK